MQDPDTHNDSCCEPPKKSSKYINRVTILVSFVALLLISSYFTSFFVPFRKSFYFYANIVWWALLIGFFIGGLIERFVPATYISHILARKGAGSIVRAVLLGFLMSACSHGLLAIAIGLYKKGASTASVIAFLLASPWANLPFSLLLIGFFGFSYAVVFILGAIVIAIITGLIFQGLEKLKWVEVNPDTLEVEEGFSVGQDIKRRFKQAEFSRKQMMSDAKAVIRGGYHLAKMIMWWILFSVTIAAFIGGYLPEGFLAKYMGPTLMGLFVTLIVATLIEVCSEGTAPLAFEVFNQTGSVGNSFVFLMSGVATDYTEIGLIWQNIGKKTAIWMPIVAIPQIVLLALLLNYFTGS